MACSFFLEFKNATDPVKGRVTPKDIRNILTRDHLAADDLTAISGALTIKTRVPPCGACCCRLVACHLGFINGSDGKGE
jgi:hypothetical protein